MIITKEQETKFEKENNCHICGKSLMDLSPILVKNQRILNEIKNLQELIEKVPRFIPVFFHNLSGYDAHLFIKELGIDKDNIKTIANPIIKDPVLDQKGKLVKTVEIRFLNSFKFLFNSLEANTLISNQFKELSKHYPEQLDLVKRKLAYPYKYMDSPEKYDEESLPSIYKFYS
ncbi:Ribonuclease H-like domain [Cinara cedri]|uniref:Ribonuclease H-like domain n=1 Tax=Cinara cedri TaxID=506608 RepID=A0A5E4N6B6_9HEMI|nr:Ribonuclease H-like domain [Cinara cedri]